MRRSIPGLQWSSQLYHPSMLMSGTCGRFCGGWMGEIRSPVFLSLCFFLCELMYFCHSYNVVLSLISGYPRGEQWMPCAIDFVVPVGP